MKIGIMTFWESHNNYGQLLQAFALQNFLINKGHDVYFIKFYRIPPPSKKSLVSRLKTQLSVLVKESFSKTSTQNSLHVEPDRGFDHFRRSYLNIGTTSYKSLSELQLNPPVADVYICGSDQVWNNTFKVPCLPFLLAFGDSSIKRVAYAASFGQKELSSETSEIFRKYLPKFNAVSVRENSGVQICKDVGYDSAVWVPDPTLLFNKEEWSRMLNIRKNGSEMSGKNVFIYTLGNSAIRDKDKYLEHVKQLQDVKISHATANNDFTGNVYPEISEWVALISRADFVITNSFHGMVFCIIFNKNFIVLPNTGAAEGMNERITSLITKFKLEDHMMFEYSEREVDSILAKRTSWDEINNAISEWRNVADNFIKKSLI